MITVDDPRTKALQEQILADRKQRDAAYERYLQEDRIWGLIPKERICKIDFPRIPQEIRDRYLALKDMTGSVADALDSFGINGAVSASHIHPIKDGQKICGTATTLRNLPERKTVTQGYNDHDFTRMSTRDSYYLGEPGDVLVVDFGGNLDTSCMGEMSCTVAKTYGFAANIVDGCVRDVPSIMDLDYPVWSVGRTMKTGKYRLETIEVNGPIGFCGVRVEPGDLVCADDAGVCFVPAELVVPVIELCEQMMADEAVMYPMLLEKGPLDELRPLVRKRYS